MKKNIYPHILYTIRRWIGRSLAIIRPVSLRLQNEGQKKLTEYHRFSTESLTRIFLTFVFFDAKGILNGFASVAACGCRDKDCRVICYYLVYIYCPKESKCRTLARFVWFERLVFEKNIRVYIISRIYYIKSNTNLPNQTNHLICRHNQKKTV